MINVTLDQFLITLSSYKCSFLITKYSNHFTEFNESSSFRASSRKKHRGSVRASHPAALSSKHSSDFFSHQKICQDMSLITAKLVDSIRDQTHQVLSKIRFCKCSAAEAGISTTKKYLITATENVCAQLTKLNQATQRLAKSSNYFSRALLPSPSKQNQLEACQELTGVHIQGLVTPCRAL